MGFLLSSNKILQTSNIQNSLTKIVFRSKGNVTNTKKLDLLCKKELVLLCITLLPAIYIHFFCMTWIMKRLCLENLWRRFIGDFITPSTISGFVKIHKFQSLAWNVKRIVFTQLQVKSKGKAR